MSDRERKLSKTLCKAIAEGKVVETANSLDLKNFTTRYSLSQILLQATATIREKTDRNLDLELMFSDDLKNQHQHVLERCFGLIQESSADDYAASEIKWSPTKKRKEMLLPDMRYLVVSEPSHSTSHIPGMLPAASKPLGFVSFMITYEDGYEVIYVYEIHLAVELRSLGIGKILMNMVESIGRRAAIEKCMLTVFKSNKKAVKWYQHCGYSVDDFSPGPRVLRNGSVKEASYLILSKRLKDDPT